MFYDKWLSEGTSQSKTDKVRSDQKRTLRLLTILGPAELAL
jgi:hypothetical protein